MSLSRWFQPSSSANTATTSSRIKLSAIGSDVTLADLNNASVAVSNMAERRSLRAKTVPPSVKVSCVEHFNIYGMSSVLKTFKRRYPDLNFSESSVRRWKKTHNRLYDNNASAERIDLIRAFPDKRGRPNYMSSELLSKVNQIILGSRTVGIGISMEDVISIGNSVMTTNSPSLLKENGGSVELTVDWGRSVLKNLNYSRKKATTEKRKPSEEFLKETKLQFQNAIYQEVSGHQIPTSLVLNTDQTPLPYVNTGNFTYERRGENVVPLVGKGDKRMITATFTVSADGLFLPIQLIYTGK